MILTLAQIRAITAGAADIREENGRVRFFRFTEAEASTFENKNVYCTAGVQMEFETDASALRLCVQITPGYTIRSYFALDVLVDGRPVGAICNLRDEDCTEDYANRTYQTGEFSGSFFLGAGKKRVRIVFPHSVTAEIIQMELTDASFLTSVKRKKTLVAYGDSITQGFDALHPFCTYAMRLADALDMCLCNKALGGAIFMPTLVDAAEDASADAVLVAYGTNDWGGHSADSFRAGADAFLANAVKRYPGVPVFALSPIWRKDYDTPHEMGAFSRVEEILREVGKTYEDVTVVSGWDLVPHTEECFGDLSLHPNDAGFSHYCANLLKKLPLM